MLTLTEREDSYIAGTKIGGKKAAKTNKEQFGDDWYAKIGAMGGKKGKVDGVIKGFAAMEPELRKEYGAKGGTISRKAK